MILDTEWTERALCREVDGDTFYPAKGQSTRPATAVCALCRVKVECLDYALAMHERHGVWGGLSERMRRPRHVAYDAAHAVAS